MKNIGLLLYWARELVTDDTEKAGETPCHLCFELDWRDLLSAATGVLE